MIWLQNIPLYIITTNFNIPIRITENVCILILQVYKILTNYAILKKPTITETIRLHRFHRFGHVQRMDENRIPKRVLYMNLETRPRGRPQNRWQDEVREDGRPVGGKEWQEKVYDRKEWKKLLRMPRNRSILHMPME
jgi:hypothetical protein